MKSAGRGTDTSGVEVTNVSPHGMWLLVDNRELFLAFEDFPWFQDASIRQITHVERPTPSHLYWPALDIDLELESIANPNHYPLVSRMRAPVVSETPSSAATGKGELVTRRPSTRRSGGKKKE